MKQRSIMAVIIFSIITFGIYDLFWLAKVKKDLNERTDVHVPTMWLLFAPLLLLIVGVPVMLVISSASTQNSGSPNTAASLMSIVIGFVAILLVIPTTFYWTFKFSKAVNHFTHGELNTAMTFILLWILRFIGLAVIQDKFNDMLATGAAGAPGTMAPAMPAPSFAATPDAMPQQPTVQPPMPAQQPPVDPTQPQSYEQQAPQGPQQPPAGPSGPVVQ